MKNLGLLFMLIALALVIEPIRGIGMMEFGPGMAGNRVEIFCLNHGGYPRDGNCYFPDGSYCELWSFYNGTCPGQEYYDQALWEEEDHRFLYGDDTIYQPYSYWPYEYYYGPP